MAAPQLMCDEFIYAGIAKSLASNGQFAFRHEPNTVSLLYPALIAPAWWAHSMETAYGLAKAINALAMTLAAIPFFFWARRVSSPLYALVATALLLLLPAFDYTAMLMTESAFFPAVMLATYAIARSLERPTVPAQLLVVGAIVVALGVRAQAAMLVLVLPSAILLDAALDRGPSPERFWVRYARALKPHWIALGGLVALGLLYVAFLMTRGTGSVPYRDVLLANYSLVDGVRVAIYYLAGLTLEIGVFPVSAFIILLGLALRAPGVSRGTRAFVAVALPTLLWFLLEIGLFGSRFASSFPVERYSFYLEPLFLIALVAWLHQGLPRPRVLTALAVLVPVGLVVWFPLSKFIQDSPLYSSFGLYYFFNLVTRLGTSAGHIELLASIGAVLAGLLFVFIPRRLGPIALALPLAIFFVAVSRSAFISLKTYGFFARYETGLGRDSSWIEEAVGRNQPVTLLYTDGGADKFVTSQALMQAEFWNRNVNAVANIGSKELCPLPERDGRFDANTGHIEPAAGKGNLLGPVVVTSGALGLAGQRVASHPPFVAYRVRGPAHVKSQAEGFYADGWTGGTASFKEFEAAPPGSRLLVGVSRAAWLGPDKPGTVTIRVRALTGRVLATRRWVVHSGTARTFRLPGPRVPYSVELRVKPTFVPADYGLADTRSLGARFSISVAPQRARLTKAQ